MKLKYILIIFILTVTILCFTKYRNIIFTKAIKIKELFTEDEEEENLKKNDRNDNKKKKKDTKTLKSYPVSGNISSSTNNRLTSTGDSTIDDVRLNKLKHILRIVALRGRKQIIIKSLSNKNINYTEPIRFNLKNLPMRQKKVYPNEMKPIMDYILNQINSTKIKNDDSYHKLRLIQLHDNDLIRQETKEEVKYDLSFICKYYSNYFDNKKNNKISKIEDLIINCQIIGKKEYLDDVFITSLKAGKNVKLIINQLEITGIHSNSNFLSGYENSSNNYKLLDNFNSNKQRDIEIKEPTRINMDNNDDNNYINLQNYNPDKKSMVKINNNYKEKVTKEKNYLDSIDSLLPDSYKEPGVNNYLLTEESETSGNYQEQLQQQIIDEALKRQEEEKEEYELDSINITTEEQAIGLKPAGNIVN